jgi:hypothetical protein
LKLDERVRILPEHEEVGHLSKSSGNFEIFHGEVSRAYPEKLIGSWQ